MADVKNDKYYIDKMLESICIIQDLYNGKNLEDLENDIMLNNTIMFQFILLGEYSTRLSQEYKDSKKNISWVKIKGMRNNVVHTYDKIIYNVINDTIINDLPELKKELLIKQS